MNQLGNGLLFAARNEEALSVQEAQFSMLRRLDASEDDILVTQSNLACSYQMVGRLEQASSMYQDVYSGSLKLNGEGHYMTLAAASNYAMSLLGLQRFEEARSLLRKTMPVARRVLGEGCDITLGMRSIYAAALHNDEGATLDDLHEAVTTFEDTERIARRVLGGAHPITIGIGQALQKARAALRARETPPPRRTSPPPGSA